MARLDSHHLDAVRLLYTTLKGTSVSWALTGSTSLALQDLPLAPNDIDVQTTGEGAYSIEEQFTECMVEPVSFVSSEQIRSHFGKLVLEDTLVEIMGAVQKRREDGTWTSPVAIAEHRDIISVEGMQIPVLSLQYEAQAYDQLGRNERADVIRKHR
ncbi:nucleotidyltransferase domain-containing protein [Halocatena marina]|uniref:Nucleotidyltransferase domain-containing protein n=1 Tax=Halocatena marina TaxID=2934937 RepID=A0ABD5YNH2_9EURY|nr:hypothetical protein [Halocatena marina]